MTDDLQTFENDVLKGKLGLKRSAGMIVHRPGRETPDYPLKKWDVITKIGDKDIDNVGMIQAKGDLRLRFQYMVQRLVKGGKIPLTIVRDGKEQVVQVPVEPLHDELIRSLDGKYPSYFILRPDRLLDRHRRARRRPRAQRRLPEPADLHRQPARHPTDRQGEVPRRGAGHRLLADVPPPVGQGLFETRS